MMPSVSGSSSRPASVGVAPLTICRYSGSEARPPNMAMPMSTDAPEATATVRLLEQVSGSRASSFMARSTSRNAMTPSAPTT